MVDPVFVTGCDANYFISALVTRQSLLAASPTARLVVCDFGLTEAQRAFLAALDALAPAPRLPDGEDPFLWKAALVDYVRPLGAGAMVWLDADLVVLEDLLAPTRDALGSGAQLLFSPDTGAYNLADFCARIRTPRFQERMEALGIGQLPYVNSGVFICADLAVLDAWKAELERADPAEILFEQNAYNLVVHAGGFRVQPLNPIVWNTHGEALGHVEPTRPLPRLGLKVRQWPVMVAHATSLNDRHQEKLTMTLDLGAHSLRFSMKFFRNQLLRGFQHEMLRSLLNQHLPGLIAHGVVQPK